MARAHTTSIHGPATHRLRRLGAALLVAALLSPLAIALEGASLLASHAGAAPTVPTFTFRGEGYGHGLGMSQYGALEAAKAGLSAEQIIKHYYTGVALTSKSSGDAKVNLSASKATKSSWVVRPGYAGGSLSISGVDAAVTSGDQTYTFSVSGGQVAVTPSGGPKVTGLGSSVTVRPIGGSPPLLQVVTGSGPFGYSNVRYRGSLVLTVSGGGLKLVNVLGMEEYLYGVVPRELGSSFGPKPAASQAQAIVARSYAYGSVQSGSELYCTTQSQVYGGHSRFTSETNRRANKPSMMEQSGANAAVDATRNRVVTYGGKVVVTYFSSSNGSTTASNEDIWGGSKLGYLRSVRDPYHPTSQNWTKSYTGKELGALLASRSGSPAGAGSTTWVTDLNPTLGAGGWVKAIEVVWSNGTRVRYTTGDRVRIYLSLRSAKFTVTGGVGSGGDAGSGGEQPTDPVVNPDEPGTPPGGDPTTPPPPIVPTLPPAPGAVPVQGPIAKVEAPAASSVDRARLTQIRAMIADLDPELAAAAKEAASLLDDVEDLKAKEEASRVRLEEISARYEVQQQLLAMLANNYYHVGVGDLLEMLLSAETFSEFISRGQYMLSHLESSADLVAEVEITRRQLESESATLRQLVGETEEKWAQALAQEEQLRAERDALMMQVRP